MKVRMIVASLFIMMTLSACGGKEDIPEADSSIPAIRSLFFTAPTAGHIPDWDIYPIRMNRRWRNFYLMVTRL